MLKFSRHRTSGTSIQNTQDILIVLMQKLGKKKKKEPYAHKS